MGTSFQFNASSGGGKVESLQRPTRIQDEDMVPDPESAFELPEGTVKISSRIPGDTAARIDVIRRIWQTEARVQAAQKGAVKGFKGQELADYVEAAADRVDLSHVVARLLSTASLKELALWGGYPETKEKLEALIRQVEAQAKK